MTTDRKGFKLETVYDSDSDSDSDDEADECFFARAAKKEEFRPDKEYPGWPEMEATPMGNTMRDTDVDDVNHQENDGTYGPHHADRYPDGARNLSKEDMHNPLNTESMSHLPPESLRDRTFLLPTDDESGTRVRAEIKMIMNPEETDKDKIRYLIVDSNKAEDIVAYNDVINYPSASCSTGSRSWG